MSDGGRILFVDMGLLALPLWIQQNLLRSIGQMDETYSTANHLDSDFGVCCDLYALDLRLFGPMTSTTAPLFFKLSREIRFKCKL
jgi:hypothetical protein